MKKTLLSKKQVLADMLIRPPYMRYRHLHPSTLKKLVERTKPPAPLKYALNQTNIQSIKLPHPAPLGIKDSTISFSIERTTSGNLPVYLDYKNQRNIKRTIIRKVSGDIDAFCQELKKVVSNYQVRQKVGRVQIPGVHRESVNTWLLKLGF